jgi:hypothetical protein
MGKKPLDTNHPVVVAFLAISTQSKPVSDDQVLEIIKKKHSSLRDTTRDTLNALLGGSRADTLRDSVNGFIRKSYTVNKHSVDKAVRCEYVVYGGVRRDGTKERDDKFYEIVNSEPRWLDVGAFKSPKPGAQSRSQEQTPVAASKRRRPVAAAAESGTLSKGSKTRPREPCQTRKRPLAHHGGRAHDQGPLLAEDQEWHDGQRDRQDPRLQALESAFSRPCYHPLSMDPQDLC